MKNIYDGRFDLELENVGGDRTFLFPDDFLAVYNARNKNSLITFDAFICDMGYGEILELHDPISTHVNHNMLYGNDYFNKIIIPEDKRILIPAKVKPRLGLEDKAILAGNWDYIELWSPERYKNYLDSFEEEQEITDWSAMFI